MNLVQAMEQLSKAKGRSEHVMSIFMDIRGFSQFSKQNESPNIAIYVKKLFLRVLADYFPEATYAKPTGDGLLIIYPYDEETLSSVADKVVDACLRCVKDFPALCNGDPMLNFALPDKVGFGVSRGLACCLYQGEVIIDYSGHMLNLAARLNGAARPAGVVLDGSFLTVGMQKNLLDKFSENEIYLKGVADDTAIKVLSEKERVIIGGQYKAPINEVRWISETIEFNRAELKNIGTWKHDLSVKIDESKGLKLEVRYPVPRARDMRQQFFESENIAYFAEPEPYLRLKIAEIEKELTKQKAPSKSKIFLDVSYVARR